MNTHFFTALESPAVDAETGTIKACSLISLGDARGHFDKKGRQVIVDEVTLEQIWRQCKKLATVKVKADHGSGVFEIVGWADNFALTADKVTADVHFYESEPQRDRLLEIAEKNPTHMGFSMEFIGEDKPSGKVCLARCNEVFAAALVDFAAANTSLFSAPGDPPADEPNKEQTTNNMEPNETNEPTLKDLMAKFEELNTRLSALETPPSADEPKDDAPPVATDPDKTPAPNPDADKDDERTKIAELAASAAVRKMSAAIGARGLGSPGTAATDAPKAKHFEEYVADLAVSLFSGDQNAARAHILTNKQKFPDAWKAYADSRMVRSL